jgi:5-hydroxyisourate hydrolase
VTNAISTHILNVTNGKPGVGLVIALDSWTGSEWKELATKCTDNDGRASFADTAAALTAGVYQLRFDTAAFWKQLGQNGFFPTVTVSFQVDDPSSHYHVPLLLSPFSYTTYRGS